MATVRVTSELVESDGTEREEFYAEADSVAKATALLLENEEKVSEQDWMAWVAYQSGFNYDDDGYSFTVTDNGSRQSIVYRYVVTA